MDYRSLHMKTVAEIRAFAKAEGIKLPAGLSKAHLVERVVTALSAKDAAKQVPAAALPPKTQSPAVEAISPKIDPPAPETAPKVIG